MSGGFKDIIKLDRIKALERGQQAVEKVLIQRLAAVGRELRDIKKAAEDRTWRGRFRRLVDWLGKK